ncbi:methyltransferase [Fictibacillus macauensis ZFHKF-1]|uniref:Methyltransferase n=1 Tax=Fictibacillus macauensis ZFHKF-1 TaxID=1196324 RepID=I8UDM9_9BACL|nr:16S rRNA (guanine(966)-N(2))-methyltransferase RsmD [Fictibacillus macauensis]EIT84913.1 methyltransferase [Fictibacillus macauensis ZFHKF-1]
MRVISGERKGHPLKAVPGHSTRPTTDKIKESIFNMIGPYFDGGLGLDLYGGSGSLGIEALSRGLDRMIFVDKEMKAIQTIKTNLAACRYEEQTEVYRNEALRALKALKKRDLQFNLVLLDPPYAREKIVQDIEMLLDFSLLDRNVVIMVEHDPSANVPDHIGELLKTKEERYGNTTQVSIYAFASDLEKEEA